MQTERLELNNTQARKTIQCCGMDRIQSKMLKALCTKAFTCKAFSVCSTALSMKNNGYDVVHTSLDANAHELRLFFIPHRNRVLHSLQHTFIHFLSFEEFKSIKMVTDKEYFCL